MGPPVRGCPHKKTYSWLQRLGKKPIDGPTSLNQHYFLPASLFGEAFFWQGSYCSARLPIEKTSPPTPQHRPATTTEHGTQDSALCCRPQAFGLLIFFNKLVKACLFRLDLCHFFKALREISLHINHVLISDTSTTGVAPLQESSVQIK